MKPCRVCGGDRISPGQRRKRNHICVWCHAARQRARSGRAPRPRTTKVVTLIVDAMQRRPYATTTHELAERLGISRRVCSARVSDLVAAGVLRHTGHRLRYGNGGPSFCFELTKATS